MQPAASEVSSSYPTFVMEFFGHKLVIDLNRDVWIDDLNIHVTPQEGVMLDFLLRNSGIVVTKEMFYDELYVHKMHEPSIKLIDLYICRLRKKLGVLATCIRTVWGRGHLWDNGESELHLPIRKAPNPLGYVKTAKYGDIIQRDTLPTMEQVQRWTLRHKLAVAQALAKGLLSSDEAYVRYRLSAHEQTTWLRCLEHYGVEGLRVTWLKFYREAEKAQHTMAA